ncbi:hypothetical protein L1887_21063 [Cichorium endivia]|nr:hypothetical protein L1887_21063 [Cichorium endivia]
MIANAPPSPSTTSSISCRLRRSQKHRDYNHHYSLPSYGDQPGPSNTYSPSLLPLFLLSPFSPHSYFPPITAPGFTVMPSIPFAHLHVFDCPSFFQSLPLLLRSPSAAPLPNPKLIQTNNQRDHHNSRQLSHRTFARLQEHANWKRCTLLLSTLPYSAERTRLVDPAERTRLFLVLLSSPKVDVVIDTGNPLLNLIVDGFLKIGTVAAAKTVVEETYHVVKRAIGGSLFINPEAEMHSVGVHSVIPNEQHDLGSVFSLFG